VRGISFSMGTEKLGIVGESGSGKSLTARSILRLTPRSATVTASRLQFSGVDLLSVPERQMRELRGKRITLIPQDPKFSLNPVMRVGKQMTEVLRIHERMSFRCAKERALAMLAEVQIRDPARVFDLYPHEVSGGMGQRIMIAMMLSPKPDLIIADEPTSALDVTVRRQILAILDELVRKSGAGLMLISHDLNLVADFCDRVLVMYAGRILEEIPGRDLHNARHPYTRALLGSLPRIDYPVPMLSVPVRDSTWLDGPVFRPEH
jgi:peptide/nickel transport system ATP-binding protein